MATIMQELKPFLGPPVHCVLGCSPATQNSEQGAGGSEAPAKGRRGSRYVDRRHAGR